MYKNKSILAIITARGGSKRLKGKNVKMLGGKPLIAWTIEAAQKSRFIDRVILSSDDKEIISVSESCGCEVPFVRPAELASDGASSAGVVLHALSKVGGYDYAVLLQPTSPFRAPADLDGAISLCADSGAPSVVSVRRIREKPEWMGYTGEDGAFSYLSPNSPVKSEDLRILNGAVYVVRTDWFLEARAFEGGGTIAYEMPWDRSVDIDTEEDFAYAEFLLAKRATDEILKG